MAEAVWYPYCFFCKHFGELDKKLDDYVCHAFPKGIPAEIIYRKLQHRALYPGQEGDYAFTSIAKEYGEADQLTPEPPVGVEID